MKIRILIGFIAILTLYFGEAMACSCALDADEIEVAVEKAFDSSESVVLAKVESIEKFSSEDESFDNNESISDQMEDYLLDSELTQFSEIKSWKGSHGQQFFTKIITACCLCGKRFNVGEEYLLYLYKNDDDTYATGICHRTTHVKNASKDIEILNKLVPSE